MNKAQLELNNRLLAAAKAGDAAELRRLLDAGACALAHDEHDCCALTLACRAGSLECVKLLVEHGANVNDNNGYFTPLMAACREGHVVVARYLLEETDADVRDEECEDWTALHYAVYSGSTELVELVLSHGAEINGWTPDGTEFALACREGDVPMAKCLLAHGADPLADTRTLCRACSGGSLELVQLVLEAWKRTGKDYVRVLQSEHPMESIVVWSHGFNPDIAQLIYDHGFRFDGMHGENGWWNQYKDRIDAQAEKWLREHGAFDESQLPPPWPKRDLLPVAEAAGQGRVALQSLIDAGCDVNATEFPGGPTALCRACERDDEAAIRTLLAAGADAGVTPWNGRYNVFTLPYYVNESCISLSCLDLLCRHGADPDFHGLDGNTPLHRFLQRRRPEHALRLLEMGVDIEARNEETIALGPTPFLLACWEGLLSVAQKLAEMGCDTHAVDNEGNTALILAVRCLGARGNEEERRFLTLVKWLLDTGADVNAANHEGKTALMEGGTPEIGMLLLDRGARADAVSRRGYTALHNYSDPVILQRLLDMGCPLHDASDSGSPLECFVGARNVKAVSMLIRAGVNVNTRCKSDFGTPLHWACHSWYVPVSTEILRMLLEAGADPNAQNDHLYTPLMVLCKLKEASLEHVRLLLEHGADPTLENLDGKTALDIARDAEEQEIVEYMQSLTTPYHPL